MPNQLSNTYQFQIKELEQNLRADLRELRQVILKFDESILQLWLSSINHQVKTYKLKVGTHYFWVRSSSLDNSYAFDLLIARTKLFDCLSRFSRHFTYLEHQVLFEAAFSRKYRSISEDTRRSTLSARPTNKQKTMTFVGYRVLDAQIDYHLATIFNHPLAYRYKLANGQSELPK